MTARITPRQYERVAGEVYGRDPECIARVLDPDHVCQGRRTLAHVPEAAKNAYGKKPPFDRFHLVSECWAANSGGLRPWSEMHRDLERGWLAKWYGPPPYPAPDGG